MAKKNNAEVMPRVAHTLKDFEQADRLGRIYMHLMSPDRFLLNDGEAKLYRKMLWCYPLLADGKPRSVVINMLCEIDGGIWKSQAAKIVKDTESVFANFGRINKEFLRGIKREKLLSLAQLIEKRFLTNDKNGVLDTDAEQILQATEIVRRLWESIGKNDQLDQATNDLAEAADLPTVSFSDANFDLADFEDV